MPSGSTRAARSPGLPRGATRGRGARSPGRSPAPTSRYRSISRRSPVYDRNRNFEGFRAVSAWRVQGDAAADPEGIGLVLVRLAGSPNA